MTNFLTEETPVKVMGLLSVALTSMFFLFVVTVTNASFQGAENPFPEGPSPANVVAVLDVASNSYSNFLNANLITPASQQFAFVTDNLSFIADNAGPQIVQMAGLQNLGQQSVTLASQPKVAGASTQVVWR